MHNESSSRVTQSNRESWSVVYSYPCQEHSFVKCNLWGNLKCKIFFKILFFYCTKILISTVFAIYNNKKMYWAANQHITIISKRSCDTKYWSNGCWKFSFVITRINCISISILKKKRVILNCNNISQYYSFYCFQCLFFLRWLRKFGMSPSILRSFYTCSVESILSNRKALQRVVRTARHIVGGELPSLQDIYTRRCIRKARRIIKDSSHPSHRLFSLLPSGRRLRSIPSRTSRLRDSFFPQAIRLMNSQN